LNAAKLRKDWDHFFASRWLEDSAQPGWNPWAYPHKR
jgi:hypothetical protein